MKVISLAKGWGRQTGLLNKKLDYWATLLYIFLQL